MDGTITRYGHKQQKHTFYIDTIQARHLKTLYNSYTNYSQKNIRMAYGSVYMCISIRQFVIEMMQGEIYVNGISMDEIRDWYVANTGYVLQLATPYYEELTVRENMTLAAQIRLPKSLSMEERFERVEQVMREVSGVCQGYVLILAMKVVMIL